MTKKTCKTSLSSFRNCPQIKINRNFHAGNFGAAPAFGLAGEAGWEILLKIDLFCRVVNMEKLWFTSRTVSHDQRYWQYHTTNGTDSITWPTVLTVSHDQRYWQYHTTNGTDSITRPTVLTVSHDQRHWQYHTTNGTDSITRPTVLTVSHDQRYWQYHTTNGTGHFTGSAVPQALAHFSSAKLILAVDWVHIQSTVTTNNINNSLYTSCALKGLVGKGARSSFVERKGKIADLANCIILKVKFGQKTIHIISNHNIIYFFFCGTKRQVITNMFPTQQKSRSPAVNYILYVYIYIFF